MNSVRTRVTDWWRDKTEWQRWSTVTEGFVVLITTFLTGVVIIGQINAIDQWVISPMGWGVYTLLLFGLFGPPLTRLNIWPVATAIFVSVDWPKPLHELLLEDVVLIFEVVRERVWYALAGLSLPIIFGLLNLWILFEESGAQFTDQQINDLLGTTALLTAVVAIVQIAIVLTLIGRYVGSIPAPTKGVWGHE